MGLPIRLLRIFYAGQYLHIRAAYSKCISPIQCRRVHIMDAKHLGILKYGLFGIMAVALSACSVSPTSKASFSSKTAVVGEIKTETKFKAGKRFGPALVPKSSAVLYDKSIRRFLTKGPRSFTRTITERLFERFVTRT